MEEQDVKRFIAGLKTIIRRSWPTQEEFAAGITSKVNMSNVLRGKGGTSHKMRQAFAEKAGMTIEEIIALGSSDEPVKQIEAVPTEKSNIDLSKLPSMSPNELSSVTQQFSWELHTKFLSTTKEITDALKHLVDDRVILLSRLNRKQAILNIIDTPVKVIDSNCTLLYCNEAYTELYGKAEDETCVEIEDGQSVCIGENVFNTGKKEKAITTTQGKSYYYTAYPIFTMTGKIQQVVVLFQNLDTIKGLLSAQGWTPPKGKSNVHIDKKK